MSQARPLTFTQVLPKREHSATVIFLHGLGDTGSGWLPVASQLSKDMPHVKWILPNARSRPITFNGGMDYPAWYDVFQVGTASLPTKEDEAGILESAESVTELITKEESMGIPSDRIIVAGFSQGGSLSLFIGMTSPRKLAGVVALSTYLSCKDKMKTMLSPYAKSLPVFMAHGAADRTVLYARAELSARTLQRDFGLGLPVADRLSEGGITFRTYPHMGHESCDTEIGDLRNWLKTIVPHIEPADQEMEP